LCGRLSFCGAWAASSSGDANAANTAIAVMHVNILGCMLPPLWVHFLNAKELNRCGLRFLTSVNANHAVQSRP
jgi:hypothetical protein